MSAISREKMQSYLDTHAKMWGTAIPTTLRLAQLRQMIETYGSAEVARQVMQEGEWAREPAQITDEQYGEAAAAEHCPVAQDLTLRPERTHEGTVRGYHKKQEAFRKIAMWMVKANKLGLLHKWEGEEKKSPLDVTGRVLQERVQFPSQQDPQTLVGLGKMECFYSADLLKNIDFAQKGHRTDLAPTPLEQEKFRIAWDTFADAVEHAETTVEVALNLAVRVGEELKKAKREGRGYS